MANIEQESAEAFGIENVANSDPSPNSTPKVSVENVIGNAGVSDWQIGLSNEINETYNYANSSLWLGVIPAFYRDYAWRYVRQALQWLDGYVQALHQNGSSGIMSTRIATKLITGLTKQVVGEKLVFKPASKTFDEKTKQALKKVSKWYDENNTIKAVFAAIGFSLGVGTSLLKANVKDFTDIWWEAVRMDHCFYLADFRNEIQDVTCLIRGYTDTRKEKTTSQFFLVEHRFYHTITKKDKYFALVEKQPDGTLKTIHHVGEKVPMVEYKVHRVFGSTMNNTMPSFTKTGSIPWDQIPYDIREAIKSNYSTIRVDEPKQLPFRDLGVVALLNGEIDLSVPNATNFGESMIVGIQDDLIIYEVACSYLLRDMYLGKGTVYLPKNLNMTDLTGIKGGSSDIMRGIGDVKYETVAGIDPDKNKLLVQQFEIRADEWQKVKENALKSIAVKWGMSPKILASFLAGGGQQQTATQVDSEDDLSIAFIYHTRAYFKNALNKLLEETLNFYGIPENIKIDFASPSLLNKDRLIDRVSRELDAGLIDIEDAIRTIYPDLDEEALQDKIDKAKVVQEQKKVEQQNEFDWANGGFEENQPKDIEGTTFPTN